LADLQSAIDCHVLDSDSDSVYWTSSQSPES